MKTIKTFLLVLFSISFTLQAQTIDVKGKVKNQSLNKANQKTDQGIEKGLNKVEEGVKNLFKGNKKKNKTNEQTSGNQSISENKKESQKSDTTKLESYSKYDFVPGEKVILFDDFSQDAVGDFPALWTADAAGEINTLNIAPGNWLNLNSGEGTYALLKTLELPKNFIVEFDIVPKTMGGRIAAELVLYQEAKPMEIDQNGLPGVAGAKVLIESENWRATGYKSGQNSVVADSKINFAKAEKVNHVIVWVQNRRLRIYHQSAKVMDIPTLLFDGTKPNRICFKLFRGASCGSYISNLRITDAAPDMRSKLLTEGKIVSYGIYFDVNKDIVKPESYGTLKEIAKVLTDNPDIRIKIVGHTDADGADATNLELSKKRGESVKKELIKTFGIDASRLEADGLGESQPIVPNDTPANKALNRRVEFIKL